MLMTRVHGTMDRYKLLEWMERCINAGGIPQLVEEYGGRNFLAEDMILVRCWGAGKEVPGGLFKISDPELLEVLKRYTPLKSAYKYVLNWLKEHAAGATATAIPATATY